MTLLHVLTSSFHLACKQVASHRRKCFGSMLLTFLCGRHKKKFALCHSHSFKKLFLRWSCFLNAKQWVLSEICKGENCQSYKTTAWYKQTCALGTIPLPPNSSFLGPKSILLDSFRGAFSTCAWVPGAVWVGTAGKPGPEKRSHAPSTDFCSMMTPKSPGELGFFGNKTMHKSCEFKASMDNLCFLWPYGSPQL